MVNERASNWCRTNDRGTRIRLIRQNVCNPRVLEMRRDLLAVSVIDTVHLSLITKLKIQEDPKANGDFESPCHPCKGAAGRSPY
jgi:hypothetical protein